MIIDKLYIKPNKTIIIAEAGINHNGDLVKAKQLIDVASQSGADIVKFQTHMPKHQMLKKTKGASYVSEDIYELLQSVELTYEEHMKLKDYAESKDLVFMSTGFCKEAIDLLDEVGVSAYKIGSGELNNIPLLKYIASKNKPVILSTGMSLIRDITRAVKCFNKNQLVILHCVSLYPPSFDQLNLKLITELKKRYGVPVGFSDHSLSIYPVMAAVALGAQVVEKHFTVSRRWKGPDQKCSLEPNELKQMVDGVRIVEQCLGNKKQIFADEQSVINMARHSIVTKCVIEEGETITADKLTTKRPGTGIHPKYLIKFKKQYATKRLPQDHLLSWDDMVLADLKKR